jgi:hypothetical protein
MQSRPLHPSVAAIPILAIPLVFIAIIVIWAKVDEFLGYREVSRYIRDHRSLVARRLENPKVHSFSLSHHTSQSGTLLIQIDVDDKATFEMLESDLHDIWGMRFPPQWKTNIRSKEELANNFGYAAWGMAEVGEGLGRLMIAGLASIAQAIFFTGLAVRRIWRETGDAGKGKETSQI